MITLRLKTRRHRPTLNEILFVGHLSPFYGRMVALESSREFFVLCEPPANDIRRWANIYRIWHVDGWSPPWFYSQHQQRVVGPD